MEIYSGNRFNLFDFFPPTLSLVSLQFLKDRKKKKSIFNEKKQLSLPPSCIITLCVFLMGTYLRFIIALWSVRQKLYAWHHIFLLDRVLMNETLCNVLRKLNAILRYKKDVLTKKKKKSLYDLYTYIARVLWPAKLGSYYFVSFLAVAFTFGSSNISCYTGLVVTEPTP